MNRFQRAWAAFQGKIIVPQAVIMLPRPTEPDQGWFLLTIEEFKTTVLARARVVYEKRTKGSGLRKSFERSSEYANAIAAIRNAVNGTDPKNG
jgi:hypothetical protein